MVCVNLFHKLSDVWHGSRPKSFASLSLSRSHSRSERRSHFYSSISSQEDKTVRQYLSRLSRPSFHCPPLWSQLRRAARCGVCGCWMSRTKKGAEGTGSVGHAVIPLPPRLTTREKVPARFTVAPLGNQNLADVPVPSALPLIELPASVVTAPTCPFAP